jgi:lipoate-protein ligase A
MKEEKIIFTIDQDFLGKINMKLDEQNATLTSTDSIIRVRLYSWKPYTISLGAHQDILQINEVKAHDLGYDIIRRPTGGRAVLHAEEITYSITMKILNGTLHQTYALINNAIKIGLEKYGVKNLEFSRSQPDFKTEYKIGDSASCFNSSALNELTWNGKKIVGSAQRRYDDTLLQHGSILIGDEHLNLINCLSCYNENELSIDKMKLRLKSKTATIKQTLNSDNINFNEIANSLKQGFEDVVN